MFPKYLEEESCFDVSTENTLCCLQLKLPFQGHFRKRLKKNPDKTFEKEVGEESRGRTDLITGVGFMVSLFL